MRGVMKRKWTRPTQRADLTRDQVKFMADYMQCPYCHSALWAGPSGGMSQNMFCSSQECNSRFNASPPLYFGEFTGGCPADLWEKRS